MAGKQGQRYMTEKERLKLEALRRAGLSVTKIARQLGFCRQTIYNELKRGKVEQIRWRSGYLVDVMEYSADKGEQLHRYNQTAKGRPLKIGSNQTYADFLERKIVQDRFSPAAALAAARREDFGVSVCVATLYSYIEKGVFLRLSRKHLWEKSKKKKQGEDQERRIAHPKLPSIEDRPEAIQARQERGHWEMDLIVGKARSRAALLVLTERVSRKALLWKLPDKKVASVRKVFDRLERKMGKRFCEVFRSITTDNGPEFLEYDRLCRSIHGGRRFDVWYCHSYSAWEKGSCENQNRMIRRFYPKGTDFGKITRKQIAETQRWMNQYPRRILGWKTPEEMAA